MTVKLPPSPRPERLIGPGSFGLLALAAAALVPSGAFAQAGAKPEVMMLLGSSRTMELTLGDANGIGLPPQCLGAGQAWFPAAPVGQKSRMVVLKEVLTGTQAQGAPYYCQRYDACTQNPAPPNGCFAMVSGEDDNIPHARALCCDMAGVGPACSSFVPCGGDTGDLTTVPGVGLQGAAENQALSYAPGDGRTATDGVLYQTRSDVKWGLMTLDSTPDPRNGWEGQFSYPDTGYDGPNGRVNVAINAAGQLTEPDLALPAANLQQGISAPVGMPWRGVFDRRADEDVFSRQPPTGLINLGIRSALSPFGPLIGGNVGLNAQNPFVWVAEDDASVASHNLYVAQRLRQVVPMGSNPLGPALHDAIEYYRREGAAGGDQQFACRRRSLVVVTDSAPSAYTGGQDCIADADCAGNVPGGVCVGVVDPDTGGARRVCRYPDSFPYRTTAEYAGTLNQMGIPVFVIGITPKPGDEQILSNIAAAGSPGLGPNGGGGYYRVANADQLRAALMMVRNSVASGIRSHSKPVVLLPRKGKGDGNLGAGENIIKQWRLNAWTEIPGSGDPYSYGTLQRTDIGCATAAQRQADPTLDSMARRLLGYARYEDALASRVTDRKVISRFPDTNFTGLGGGGANLYRSDGSVGNYVPLATVKTMLDIADAGPIINGLAPADQVKQVGLQMNGYFGTRGLPSGINGALGRRQLGAILSSDLTPLAAPAMPLTQQGYVEFQNAHAYRSTLVAAGASDGLLHIFRVDDGNEVLSFVPRSAWANLKSSATSKTVDGPMAIGDVAACRKYGVRAPNGCPDALTRDSFRTTLVGAVGAEGANIFGVDLTRITDLSNRAPNTNLAALDTAVLALNLFFQGADATRPYIWDVTKATEPQLGRSVSRPVLTHVRVDDAVRAAVVVGCGDQAAGPIAPDTAGEGRCVLILDAVTGAQIAKIDNSRIEDSGKPMNYPMTGSPSVWPEGTLAPAERIYIGDRVGRMWRIDLRSTTPANWSATYVFPTGGAADSGYTIGRGVVGRPATFVREDGRIGIVYVTGNAAPLAVGVPAARSHAISLTDGLQVVNGQPRFVATPNWVMPLGIDEVATGEPVVRDLMALFTTSQVDVGVCASKTGRIYGVHAVETLRAANGAPRTFLTADGRNLSVKPMIPFYNALGAREGETLALVLPPGRVAYGVTLAEVASCTPGDPSATEAVMNLADDENGGANALQPAQMQAERVQANNTLTRLAFNNSVFASARKAELSLCLTCGKDGKGQGTAPRRSGVPFASTVSYWGATLVD